MKQGVLGKWNDAFKEKRIKEHIIALIFLL
jgi:hypothetical protein